MQGSRQREEAIECDALTFGEQSGKRSQKTFSRLSFGDCLVSQWHCYWAVCDLSIEMAMRTFDEMK